MKRETYFKEIENRFYSKENEDVAIAFFDSVASAVKQWPEQALEIGCGYGLAASYFVNVVGRLRLFDVDQTALNFVEWKFGKKVEVFSDLTYEQEDGMIYFFLSLHHIYGFKDVLDEAISHIVRRGGFVAICEFEPSEKCVFHMSEAAPYDGLGKAAFDWIRVRYPQLNLYFSDLKEIIAHGNFFRCYSLIIK